MAYRSTPLENGYSPSELLFGRKIRTMVPVLPSNLLPCWSQMSQLHQKDNNIKEKQKHYFDQHHRVKQLPCRAERASNLTFSKCLHLVDLNNPPILMTHDKIAVTTNIRA